MEAIFEGLLYFIFEIVSEIVGEILGTIFEGFFDSLISGNFLTSINRHLPDSASISNEITTLDISGYKKENS